MKRKKTQKKHHIRSSRHEHKKTKKYDEDEETEVFELATGENSPMFWGDVDKKLLKKHSQSKTMRAKKRRRN